MKYALLSALLLVGTMVGCSKKEDSAPTSTLVGKWRWTNDKTVYTYKNGAPPSTYIPSISTGTNAFIARYTADGQFSAAANPSG